MTLVDVPPPPPPPPPPPLPPLPAAQARRRFDWLSALTLVGVVGVAAIVRSTVAVVLALFVIVVPFERLFPRHRQPLRRAGLAIDLAYALTSTALQAAAIAFGLVLGVVSLLWVPGLLVRPLVSALPAGARMLIGAVLFDFLIYWVHRFSHEVPFLWRFHKIHHSSARLDWITAFRGHPMDGVFLTPLFVFLLAAGFDARTTGVLFVAQAVIGLFLHANVRWRWRPLHRVVITPELHHWHHSNHVEAHNSNYTTFLPLWDIVFGTYFMPRDGRRPWVYGVSEPIPGRFLAQLWLPFRGLANPVRAARHPVRAARALFASLRRGVRQMTRVARGLPALGS